MVKGYLIDLFANVILVWWTREIQVALMSSALAYSSDCRHITKKIVITILTSSGLFLLLDIGMWIFSYCRKVYHFLKTVVTYIFPIIFLYLSS